MKNKFFILASLCLALTACEQRTTHTTRETTREKDGRLDSQAGRGSTMNPNAPGNPGSTDRGMRND